MVDHQNKQSHMSQLLSQDAKIHYDLQIFFARKRKAIPLERNVNLRERNIMARKENLLRGKEIIMLWNGLSFCGKEMI